MAGESLGEDYHGNTVQKSALMSPFFQPPSGAFEPLVHIETETAGPQSTHREHGEKVQENDFSKAKRDVSWKRTGSFVKYDPRKKWATRKRSSLFKEPI
jgi:hypothetical protein